VDLLAADTARELEGTTEEAPVLPVAVNADSLATWVLPALAPLAADYCFDLYREDQEHTSVLLREGTVMAAVTADAEPVAGCSSTRLGSMRYRPMCTPAFAARWFTDGATVQQLVRAPVIVFDRKDDLQHGYLREHIGGPALPPMHYVPASADLLAAIRLGLGWGMVPDLQRRGSRDELIEMDPGGATDVVLYWQQWRLRSPSLDRVAQAVQAAARTRLEQGTAEVRR
jgi:LysR family transcriptional regulator, chromosome initiation inhibitor